MSTISASTTSTTGFKVTSDTTGTLVLQTGASPTTAVTIDANQNMGLGVTPSAWSASYTAFQLKGGGSLHYDNSGNAVYLGQNIYGNAGNKYITTAAASLYAQGSGAHLWFNAPSGTAGGAISFTQAMTLDANGQLAIGLTTASAKLTVQNSGGVGIDLVGQASDASQLRLRNQANNSNVAYFYADSSAAEIGSGASIPLKLVTGGTERARIDSSGRLLVGTTSTVDSATISVLAVGGTVIGSRVAVNGNYVLAAANSSGTVVGGVIANASTTSFPTSSDYRLKENLAPMTGALATVAALKPCTYIWKATGKEGQGFIAHELQAVVPDAVVGEKDAVDSDGNPKYQGIDTSFLVATLTAAIQEQQAIITQLQADVETLKGAV